MKISIEDTGTTARIKLDGKLDIAGAEIVSMPLATLSGRKRGVIVDMSGVTFLASIGIRHLAQAAKSLTRHGGRLVLLNPNDMVADVLTTTGVNDLMPIVRSESEAVAAVNAALQS